MLRRCGYGMLFALINYKIFVTAQADFLSLLAVCSLKTEKNTKPGG